MPYYREKDKSLVFFEGVPVNKELLTSTVSVNKELLTVTVLVNKKLLTGTVPVSKSTKNITIER